MFDVSGLSVRYVLYSLKLVVVLSCIVWLVGCDKQASTEQSVEEVKQVLLVREQAIESKDIELYKSILFKEYFENGIGFEDVVADIELLFSLEGDIEYEYQKARPSVTMNSARVVHNVEYQFPVSGKSVKAHEILYLRKVEGRWLISGGFTLGLARKARQ